MLNDDWASVTTLTNLLNAYYCVCVCLNKYLRVHMYNNDWCEWGIHSKTRMFIHSCWWYSCVYVCVESSCTIARLHVHRHGKLSLKINKKTKKMKKKTKKKHNNNKKRNRMRVERQGRAGQTDGRELSREVHRTLPRPNLHHPPYFIFMYIYISPRNMSILHVYTRNQIHIIILQQILNTFEKFHQLRLEKIIITTTTSFSCKF